MTTPNLAAFTEAIELLEPKQKKELIRLLIKDVIYDKPQSRVRLGFVTFQDCEWEPAQFSLSLDTCQEWLPETDVIRTWLRTQNPSISLSFEILTK